MLDKGVSQFTPRITVSAFLIQSRPATTCRLSVHLAGLGPALRLPRSDLHLNTSFLFLFKHLSCKSKHTVPISKDQVLFYCVNSYKIILFELLRCKSYYRCSVSSLSVTLYTVSSIQHMRNCETFLISVSAPITRDKNKCKAVRQYSAFTSFVNIQARIAAFKFH